MLNELLLDGYYQAKLRTINVLREASDRLGIRVDSVVIDENRPLTNLVENHVIKLLSSSNHQQIVTIRHAMFMDKALFNHYVAPLLEDAVKKLEN